MEKLRRLEDLAVEAYHELKRVEKEGKPWEVEQTQVLIGCAIDDIAKLKSIDKK